MSKLLLAVDGSEPALRAAAQLADRAGPRDEIHLVNVQLPVDGLARSLAGAQAVQHFHHEEGLAAMAQARARLDAAGLVYQLHILVGHPADQISRFAAEQGFDEIVMGSHGRTGLLQLLMGSVAAEVSEQAKTRVTLVK